MSKLKVGDKVRVVTQPSDEYPPVGTVFTIQSQTTNGYLRDAYGNPWRPGELELVKPEKTVTAEQISDALLAEEWSRAAIDNFLVTLGLRERPREKYVRVVLEVPESRWQSGTWRTPGYVVSHEEFEK